MADLSWAPLRLARLKFLFALTHAWPSVTALCHLQSPPASSARLAETNHKNPQGHLYPPPTHPAPTFESLSLNRSRATFFVAAGFAGRNGNKKALPEVFLGGERSLKVMVIHCLQEPNKVMVCQWWLLRNGLGWRSGKGQRQKMTVRSQIVLFHTHTHTHTHMRRFKQNYVVCFHPHESRDFNQRMMTTQCHITNQAVSFIRFCALKSETTSAVSPPGVSFFSRSKHNARETQDGRSSVFLGFLNPSVSCAKGGTVTVRHSPFRCRKEWRWRVGGGGWRWDENETFPCESIFKAGVHYQHNGPADGSSYHTGPVYIRGSQQVGSLGREGGPGRDAGQGRAAGGGGGWWMSGSLVPTRSFLGGDQHRNVTLRPNYVQTLTQILWQSNGKLNGNEKKTKKPVCIFVVIYIRTR